MSFRVTRFTGAGPEEIRRLVLGALERCAGNVTAAARALDVSRVWFWRQMKTNGISGPRGARPKRAKAVRR